MRLPSKCPQRRLFGALNDGGILVSSDFIFLSLGLTFKPNTTDIRSALNFTVIPALIDEDTKVRVIVKAIYISLMVAYWQTSCWWTLSQRKAQFYFVFCKLAEPALLD